MGNLLLDGDKLKASGRLSIQDAVQLKELLREAYGKLMKLHLDLAGVESLDLACAQVMCSANRWFREAGKEIQACSGIPSGVKASLEEMALDPGTCALEAPDKCLWAVGEGR